MAASAPPPAWWRRWGGTLWRSLWVSEERRWTFTVVVAAMFAVLQVAVHARHEFWRDEIHTWTVARNAGGFWDLVTGDRRYDGHPVLWYYLLYLISRLTRDPIGLHLATLAASIGTAVLWLRAAPRPSLVGGGRLPGPFLLLSPKRRHGGDGDLPQPAARRGRT